MKVAILQSNYIPWKGYFDIINNVDHFVVYDEMQYTKNDWRNRNLIKSRNGLQWLTIPIKVSGLFGQKINESNVMNQIWRKKHWKTIQQNYKKAPFFEKYETIFESLYLNSKEENISEINISFIKTINDILEIKTQISRSKEHLISGEKTSKLVSLCKQLGATSYLSGPGAKSYLEEQLFVNENIEVNWMDYTGYEAYSQMFNPFEHGVTILDLIFNEGPNAYKYMKSF